MEAVLSATDQQMMVSSFLEIAVGQTVDTARQFLQATSWKLEEALQLFYIGIEVGPVSQLASTLPSANDSEFENRSVADKDWGDQDGGQDVRAPLPVKRDVLYDNMVLQRGESVGHQYGTPSVVPFRNFDDEIKRPEVWEERGSSSSIAIKAQDNLASLYRPPFALMFHGSFEKAKDYARSQNKWLLINMQSTGEFSSHMLNRDTWANEAVFQTIKANFIFWQVYDDTEEGRKVCTYYKLESSPAILLLDPITGQKLRTWQGMVQPQTLLEDLVPYMDGSPSDNHFSLSNKRPRGWSQVPTLRPHIAPEVKSVGEDDELQRAMAASLENSCGSQSGDLKVDETSAKEKEDESPYLPLPSEPKVDRTLLCKIGVRLPDGRRVQRNFLRTDPIQLLWSFCFSELKSSKRSFRLTQAIPGASKNLDFNAKVTFGDLGLDNSMVSVTWE